MFKKTRNYLRLEIVMLNLPAPQPEASLPKLQFYKGPFRRAFTIGSDTGQLTHQLWDG